MRPPTQIVRLISVCVYARAQLNLLVITIRVLIIVTIYILMVNGNSCVNLCVASMPYALIASWRLIYFDCSLLLHLLGRLPEFAVVVVQHRFEVLPEQTTHVLVGRRGPPTL